MNDLGWNLGWLTLQVTFLLLPALGLLALASRRGPASGAWVATVSLAMVVLLGILAWVPIPRGEVEPTPPTARSSTAPASGEPAELDRPRPNQLAGPVEVAEGRGRLFAGLRLAWSGLERRAVAPVARFRPWGRVWAWAALAGSSFGLIRLAVGLSAVGLCRRRGRTIDDPTLIGLVEELRLAMGCARPAEILEVPDLTTPATAGWLRPMLLLPGDWRGWDEAERRAVVAHELAHVIRGDYAAGLVAKLAEVLNPFHPLVHWMSKRLHLEQELAADAMGALFAGGRSTYLRALSRLALEQDGRLTNWPARAFLPARGTLIRRIAMLRNESDAKKSVKGWSKARRLATALGMLAFTIGLATLKSPAMAGDDGPASATPAEPKAKAAPLPEGLPRFTLDYVPDYSLGVFAVRPAATLQRPGMASLMPLVRSSTDMLYAEIAGARKVDASRPGFVRLKPEDIESVVCAFDFGTAVAGPHTQPPEKRGQTMHTLVLGEAGGLTVRTITPFDWIAFLRQWNIELEEVAGARGVYFKIKSETLRKAGLHVGVYLPDDRTIVYEKQEVIEELIARKAPSPPSSLWGPDWDRVSRDLVAFAIDNHDDKAVKRLDLGRPDEKVFVEIIKGVDRFVLGLADSDSLTSHAELTGRSPQAVEALARSIPMFVNQYRTLLDAEQDEDPRALALAKRFLAALKVGQADRVLSLSAGGFGTLGDLAAMYKAIVEEEIAGAAKAKEARTGSKSERR